MTKPAANAHRLVKPWLSCSDLEIVLHEWSPCVCRLNAENEGSQGKGEWAYVASSLVKGCWIRETGPEPVLNQRPRPMRLQGLLGIV